MGLALRNRSMERQWWSLSAPVMGQFGMTIATWASFFFFVERVGAVELKVGHLTRNAFMLAFVICSGLGQTTRTVVSTLIGEGRHHEVVPAIVKLALLSYGGVWLLTHGYIAYPDWLAGPLLRRLSRKGGRGTATLGTAFAGAAVLRVVLHSGVCWPEGAGFTNQVFVIELVFEVGLARGERRSVRRWFGPNPSTSSGGRIGVPSSLCMIGGASRGAVVPAVASQGHPSLNEGSTE